MRKELSNQNSRNFGISGQSLIEILIGIAIGAILIGGAAATITLTLRSNVQNKNIQTASALAQAMLDKVTVDADADWHNVDEESGIVLGSPYYLSPKDPGFELKAGVVNESADGLVFSTSFMVAPVYRDQTTDAIAPASGSTYEDPSTKKIIAVSAWLENGQVANVTVNKYITRSRNLIFKQSDWQDGAGQTTFPSGGTAVNDKFDDSKGIKFSGSAAGLLKKSGF